MLDAELARFPGKAGVWVKHLTTGEEAAVRADEAFNSASVIKLTVLALAFEMADKGQLSLSDRITINASDYRGGSGVFQFNDPGLQPTMRDVLLQMVITSDNTATDLGIAKVGGVERVNAWIHDHGYGDALHLNSTVKDLFAKYRALPKGSSYNERTNTDRGYWLGAMTERPVRLKVVRDTVPNAVDSAVAKALSKVPADRFTTAGSFARSLVAPVAAARGPVSAQRRWLMYSSGSPSICPNSCTTAYCAY